MPFSAIPAELRFWEVPKGVPIGFSLVRLVPFKNRWIAVTLAPSELGPTLVGTIGFVEEARVARLIRRPIHET